MGSLFGFFACYAAAIYYVGFWRVAPIMLLLLCQMFSKGEKVALWKKIVYAAVIPLLLYPVFNNMLSLIMPTGTLFR